MGSGPEDRWLVAAASSGHMLASHADRERTADVLQAAFAEGRLAKDDFEARIAQAFVARTYADLAAAVAGIPAAQAVTLRPVPPTARRVVRSAAMWCTSGLVTPGIAAVAFALENLPGKAAYGAVAFAVALVYFVIWLQVGADLLWEWYAVSRRASRPCTRCAHSVASHRAPASCTARLGSLSLVRRCSCAGYVPPGTSPRAADRRVAAARTS